jgi:hypothetical protein
LIDPPALPAYTPFVGPARSITAEEIPAPLATAISPGDMAGTSNAPGDVLAAAASTVAFCNRHMRSTAYAGPVFQAAAQDTRPLSTMAGQLLTVHALVTAAEHCNLPLSVGEVIKKAIVPLERAMAAVENTLPHAAGNVQLKHEIRKALMREMDPVARLVPEVHGRMSDRSTFASIFRNDVLTSSKFKEKASQYSGHPAFPTYGQAKMLMQQALSELVPPNLQKTVGDQLKAMLSNHPGRDRTASYPNTEYRNKRHDFHTKYVTAHVLRTIEEGRNAFTGLELQPLVPSLSARMAQLVDQAEQMLPPTAVALLAAVERAAKLTLTSQQKAQLGPALEQAVAPLSPSQLVVMARNSVRSTGLVNGPWELDELPSYPAATATAGPART